MKLLIATGIYPPDIGGPATYVDKTSKALLNFGFDIQIVTYADEVKQKDLGEIKIHRINRQVNILQRYFNYFRKVLDLSKWVDLVYIQGPISEGIPASLACVLRRKKFILKIVGDYAWEQGRQRFNVNDNLDDFQTKPYVWQVELMRWLEKRVAKSASKIIVPSEYLRNIVMQWGINKEKIEVVYNAVDLGLHEHIRKTIKEKWLVTVGRLVPWKGFDTLIKLMPKLITKYPDLKLKIVGEGPQKDNLEKLIKELNLKDVVEMYGKTDHKKTLSLINSANIFILNSSYEGLSHVLLEAIALKRPILASQSGGNPELIQNKDYLFEYNNQKEILEKIDQVLSEEVKYIHNDENSLTKFFFSKMVDDTIKILKNT